jgi:hypothetical protein
MTMNHFVEAALQARHSLKESDQAEVAHGRDVVVSGCRRKTAQNDARDTARRPGQFCGDRTHGDTGGAIGRKAIDPGRYRRKSQRRQPVRGGKLQRGAVAGGEQVVLALAAPVPDGADRVDHVLGRQAITAGDFGTARVAAAERTAFG